MSLVHAGIRTKLSDIEARIDAAYILLYRGFSGYEFDITENAEASKDLRFIVSAKAVGSNGTKPFLVHGPCPTSAKNEMVKLLQTVGRKRNCRKKKEYEKSCTM